jgi:arabinan endo-1,5-alpha-L-arabinosidase
MKRTTWIAVTVVLAAVALVVPEVAQARPQGSLRAADPTLVRDGNTWVSLSTNESLSAPFAKACDPADPVWGKGFAYVPYRTGPAPDQLGDCWMGDALPGGPGPWADRPPNVGMWLWAPTMARIGNAWWLFYVARKAGTGQQCIGVAAGDRSTGPNWLHPAQPLICPSNGWWAIDPELFYDRQTSAWYLLWDSGPLNVQRFDPATASLVGPVRALLQESHPDLGFDEFTNASGQREQVIENPTMVRADSGELWLFFAANAWASNNYATGWALCGRSAPTSGGACGLVNSFDPASRYRPWWGSSARTAPVPNVDATPLTAFPDLPGFGGLSVAVPDPTGPAPQPVYATAHIYWGGASNLRTQMVFRLDTTGVTPALYEPGTVAIHGRAGSFGTDLLGPATPSGHALATRAVSGWGWPAGHNGIFNAMTADGSLVIQGGNTDVADDYVAAGVYDPKASAWSTLNATTSSGTSTVSPFVEGGKTLHGGASSWDVLPIGDGNAVAFTNLFGVPWPPYLNRRRIPPEGVWPSFGVMAKQGGRWQIVNQWTAAELARSNPDSDVDERACAPYDRLPDATSLCGGPNEMAVAPKSRDLIVALYAGDGRRTSGGLMALRVTGPDADGLFQAWIVGYYAYPEVPDIDPPNPQRPGNLGIALKTVETDPTSPLGDERFNVVADIWHADTDANPDTVPPGLDPSITQEFSYDARTGAIRPVSAPFIAGTDGTRFLGVHGGIYDRQGNLWSASNGVQVWAGGPACPFDPVRWESQPESYTTTAGGRTVWGQTCAPDYALRQGADAAGGGLFGGFLQLAEDPATGTIVGVDTWDTGNVLAVRHSGSGRDKTFTVGTLVDTGRNLLPRQGPPEQRPPVFDKTGRAWFTVHIWPPGEGHTQRIDHWVASVDLASLFAPAPVALPVAAGQQARVQAEGTRTTSTWRAAPGPGGVIPVESDAHMVLCRGACADDGVPGDGFALRGGSAEYTVYAPVAGDYEIAYRASGGAGAGVQLTTGGATGSTSLDTGGVWRLVAGPTVRLAAGVNTLRLVGSGWQLNWMTLTRR